jgi:uncharacterized protein
MDWRNSMTSEVYFTDFRSRSSKENKLTRIRELYDQAGFEELGRRDDLTAVKLHFGEEGNDTYLNPVFVRQIVDKIKERGAKPFVTDTNTLYYGSRHDSIQHLITAIKHGFDYAVIGAPVIIADGMLGENYQEVEINLKHFRRVKIAGDIEEAQIMMVISHFKGHGMSGFGGAIKNLGMGCAAVPGKIEQHECAKPLTTNGCARCGSCIISCPTSAITMEKAGAQIDYDACIGCNNCFNVCPESAITLDWESIPTFIEKMTEYALGAVRNKRGRVGYMNFLLDITPDCDCVPWSDTPIVPDIGILASKDPVAIDTASYDLVNQQTGFKNSMLLKNYDQGKDKFKGLYGKIDSQIQLNYGEKIGLGSKDYELVRID